MSARGSQGLSDILHPLFHVLLGKVLAGQLVPPRRAKPNICHVQVITAGLGFPNNTVNLLLKPLNVARSYRFPSKLIMKIGQILGPNNHLDTTTNPLNEYLGDSSASRVRLQFSPNS